MLILPCFALLNSLHVQDGEGGEKTIDYNAFVDIVTGKDPKPDNEWNLNLSMEARSTEVRRTRCPLAVVVGCSWSTQRRRCACSVLYSIHTVVRKANTTSRNNK